MGQCVPHMITQLHTRHACHVCNVVVLEIDIIKAAQRLTCCSLRILWMRVRCSMASSKKTRFIGFCLELYSASSSSTTGFIRSYVPRSSYKRPASPYARDMLHEVLSCLVIWQQRQPFMQRANTWTHCWLLTFQLRVKQSQVKHSLHCRQPIS